MTVLSHESQGVAGNLNFLMQFVSDCGDGIILLGASAVITYLLFWVIDDEINTILFLVLRSIGRALRRVFDHFNLAMAWACACATVLLSFLLFLNAFYGRPVSLFEGYVFFTGCVLSWGFERFYISELKADARFQAKQRGEL